MQTQETPSREHTANGAGVTAQNHCSNVRHGTKLGRVLRALADGERHHRFTAERKLHDHCLHSTVAKLERMGLRVDRQWVTVRGFEGAETRVMLYWLSDGQRQRARELLGIERGTA